MEKVEEYNRSICLSCDDEPQFEHADMLKHLKEVHKVDFTNGVKGTREMLMHADGRNSYIWKWKWTLDAGVTFIQETCTRRKHAFGA